MRIIDADALVDIIDEWLDAVGYATIGKGLSYYGELLGCIQDAPTIKTKPVVHGEWIKSEIENGPYLRCSVCWFSGIGAGSSYCPHCGAEMDIS